MSLQIPQNVINKLYLYQAKKRNHKAFIANRLEENHILKDIIDEVRSDE